MLLALPFWYQLGLIIVLGAIWGSFVAALCNRWPRGERVSDGRSHCEQCDTKLRPKDLIPIASYIWLRGKCRYCAQPIGANALVIELAAASIGLIAMLTLDHGQAISAAVFGWLLLPLITLDYEKLWLPNRLVLALALVGLLAGHFFTPDLTWLDRFLGALIGYLSLEIIRQVFRKLRNVEGMGAGDPKLFAAIGIWLGWQELPLTLLVACILGFVFVAWSYGRTKDRALQLPFGSFLGIAAFSIALIMPPL